MKSNIAESEWKVLEIIWDNPGIAIGKIRTALDYTGWSYSTIKTLVIRLVKKEVIEAVDTDKGKRYYALVEEENCKLDETKHFIDRIYSGSVKMMVSNLVKGSKLSDGDAKELMNLIDKMED